MFPAQCSETGYRLMPRWQRGVWGKRVGQRRRLPGRGTWALLGGGRTCPSP